MFKDDNQKCSQVVLVKENACNLLSSIFTTERLSISSELIDFTIFSASKSLCKEVLSNQSFLQLTIGHLVTKIFDRRRVDISQRLENSLVNESLERGK